MAAAVPAPGTRRPGVLFVLLALAVLLGLVAVFLSGAAPTAPPSRAGQLVVDLPPAVWGLLYLSPLLAGIVAIFVQRIRQGSARFDRSALLSFGAMFVVALLFLYVLSATGPTGGGGTVSVTGSSPPANRTTSPAPNGTLPTSNGTSVTTPDTVTITSSWLIGIAVALVACVGVLAVPGVLSRLLDRDRRARSLPAIRPGVERALAEAGAAIDRGEDLRETIVRLYVRLLAEITPRVGEVAHLTPDEIRRELLAGLGVSPSASEELTRLFEEARYSTHPIATDDAGRFRAAIRQVEDDLRRGAAS